MNHVLTIEEFRAELETMCVHTYIGRYVGVYWTMLNDGTVLIDTTIFDPSNNVVVSCTTRFAKMFEDAYESYRAIMALNE